MERNQSGKYCVRLRVYYPRHAWTLNVYFLAGSFDRSMKKLEEALDFLQRQEDKLWFWGVDRAEDMGFSAEFLKQAGMRWTAERSFLRGRPALRWRQKGKCLLRSWDRCGVDSPRRWTLFAPPLREIDVLGHPSS
jgi:hypothetical protein